MQLDTTDEETEWQVVYRGFDPTQLSLVEALLSSEEIPCRRLGPANAALLGVGDSAVIQLLSVPSSDAEDAKRIIAAAAHGFEAPDSGADSNAGADQAVTTSVPRKVRFIAAGMTALWPGLGLAYAGAVWPGLALAVWAFSARLGRGYVAALAGLVFGHVVARVIDLAASHGLLQYRRGRSTYPVVEQLMAAFVLVCAMQWSMKLIGVPVTKKVVVALSHQSRVSGAPVPPR